jgi:hypothetical protein
LDLETPLLLKLLKNKDHRLKKIPSKVGRRGRSFVNFENAILR